MGTKPARDTIVRVGRGLFLLTCAFLLCLPVGRADGVDVERATRKDDPRGARRPRVEGASVDAIGTRKFQEATRRRRPRQSSKERSPRRDRGRRAPPQPKRRIIHTPL